MKRERLLAAALAVCLCLSACSREREPLADGGPSSMELPDASSFSQPGEEGGTEDAGLSEGPVSSEPDRPASSEDTKTVTFHLAGNNAKDTIVTLEVPAQWEADGDRLICDGQTIVRFEGVSRFDQDAAPYLEDLAMDDNGSDITVEDAAIPGQEGKWCPARIEGRDGELAEGIRYYLAKGNLAVRIAYTPMPTGDFAAQRLEIEHVLSSLRLETQE